VAGVVAVWAEAPPLRRAGRFTVVVDGHKVGLVRQGEVAEFPVEPGPHNVWVTGGGSRSNTVTVTATDGETCRVVSSSTGLSMLALLPPVGLLLALIPGAMYRLRAHNPRPAAAAAAPPGGGSPSGLWWESDPVLAKRFRKGDE
jgi:hypothetical protein